LPLCESAGSRRCHSSSRQTRGFSAETVFLPVPRVVAPRAKDEVGRLIARLNAQIAFGPVGQHRARFPWFVSSYMETAVAHKLRTDFDVPYTKHFTQEPGK